MQRNLIKNVFTPSHQKYIVNAAKIFSLELNAKLVGSYAAKTKIKKEYFTINQLEILEGRLKNNPLNIDIYGRRAKIKEIESRLLKRNNTSSFKINKRELEFLKGRIINIWNLLIKRYSIDCILFEDIPHQLNDWLLYDVAKSKNILCIGCTPILINKGLISWKDYNKPSFKINNILEDKSDKQFLYNKRALDYINSLKGLSHKESIKKFTEDQKLDFLEDDKVQKPNKNREITSYLKKEFHKTKQIIKEFLRKIKYVNHYPTDIWLVNFDNKYKTNYSNYSKQIKNAHKEKEFNLKLYQKLSIKFSKNNFKKFVIVCLQYQPETSTTPLAYPFDDSKYFIEILRENLDNEISILIKDHPSQFSKEYTRYPESWRNKNFYKDITKLKNTFFLDIKTDLFLASENAIAIFNFGGNIGSELILREKHIVTMGNSWFTPCIPKHTIKNEEELKIYLKNIYYNQKVYQENAKSYISLFESICASSCNGLAGSFGIHNRKEFFEMNNIDEKENSKIIAKLYLSEINKA